VSWECASEQVIVVRDLVKNQVIQDKVGMAPIEGKSLDVSIGWFEHFNKEYDTLGKKT